MPGQRLTADACASVAGGLAECLVLYASHEVQWYRRLLIGAGNFQIAHYLGLGRALTQSGRLLFQFLGHFRVVRCDFMKS